MHYAFTGFAADVDIESEKYRWLGSARLDIYVSQYAVSLIPSAYLSIVSDMIVIRWAAKYMP